MANSSPEVHCSECGAPVKSGDKQCWMCFQKLVAASRAGSTSSAPAAPALNPYADEAGGSPKYYYTTNTKAAVGQLLAILAILPATGLAFFTTCTVFLISDDEVARGNAQERAMAYIVICCISAIVVFVLFWMLIVSLGKKTIRRVQL